ncbi:hypothetical protein ACHAXA_004054 [Cyclostephanos tholiformis]|uniref:Uncharacterized protein n=1 Tax=Cyclostephanos tholiformis TaxID=382380 RepID=A0ABD3R5X3_9STRA
MSSTTNVLSRARSFILLVNPYSTGCLVAMEIAKRGHLIMAMWTKGFNPKDLTYLAKIDNVEPWSLDNLIYAIGMTASVKACSIGKPNNYYMITRCIAGGEAGVDMVDTLSKRLGMLSNGMEDDFKNQSKKKVQVSFN